MKSIALIITIVLFSFGNVTQRGTFSEENTVELANDGLKIFNFNELQAYLGAKDANKTYVINFWATWCAPCVKELPYFEQLQANYAKKGVEVILVSLDFPKQVDSKLKPFIEKHDLKSEVILLDDVDSNTWIPKVNEDWSGAIPATLIYNKKNRAFYGRTFTYEELETELKPFIK